MNADFQYALQQDALATVGPDAEFSEKLRYVPRDDRPRRWVYGVVNRGEFAERPGMIRGGGRRIELEVRNHATLGILPSEIDTGDKIELKLDGVHWTVRTLSTTDQAGQPLVTWDTSTVRIVLV